MAEEKKQKTVVHVHYVHHFHHTAAPHVQPIMQPPPMMPPTHPGAQYIMQPPLHPGPQAQYIMQHHPTHPGPQADFIMAPMAPGFFAAHYAPPKAEREEDE